jgi:hypothetical protein
MLPEVAIVIPSYKPEFFEQSLKSAIGQTYPNIEIFVYDNCLSNEIEIICSKYSCVNYLRNERVGVLNIIDSIFIEKGYYIKFLFDDDILHPFCVERMVQFNSDNLYSMIFSASAIINKNNIISNKRRPFNGNVSINNVDLQRTTLLNFSNYIGEFSTVLFERKSLLGIEKNDIFKYNSKYFRGLTDLVFYFNITHTKPALYIDEELSYFRLDSSLNSNSTIDPSINPNFIYAITDWIELIVSCNKFGIINSLELIERKDYILKFIDKWSNIYPDVSSYKDFYLDHLALVFKD